MITVQRAAPRVLRPALAGAPRIPFTQHASLTRGFTASGVSGDETGKELATIVAEELKMETENFETPEVRAKSATTLDQRSALTLWAERPFDIRRRWQRDHLDPSRCRRTITAPRWCVAPSAFRCSRVDRSKPTSSSGALLGSIPTNMPDRPSHLGSRMQVRH
jgi:hypothetical protein